MDYIEEKHRKVMNEIAEILDGTFNPSKPRKTGFTLLVFDFANPAGRMNYISNANREDMIVAMKEFIAHSEGRAIDTPGHG